MTQEGWTKMWKFVAAVALALAAFATTLGGIAVWSTPEEAVPRGGYQCAVYTEQGCAKFVVASGGEIEVQSGGTVDFQSGATVGFDDVTVADTLNVDGDIDLDGDGFDVNITAGGSIDTDGATNLSASAGDITIDAEAGSLLLIGSEAAADAIELDANDTVTSGIDIDVGSVSGLTIDGGLVDIGGGSYATANGDNDLGVAGDLEVDGELDLDGGANVAGDFTVVGTASWGCSDTTIDGDLTITGTMTAEDVTITDTLNVDGDIDLDGDGFDVNITAGGSIDTDGATNLSASAGDITIDAEAGSLLLIGSEAAADAIELDANDTVTSGIDIDVGSVSGLTIDGGLVDVGGGSCSVADGDNDLCVAADLEVDGELELDGALDADSTANFAGAVTFAGLFYPSFADETITDGETLTPTVTVYNLDSAGAVTMTLAACSTDGQPLILVGDDANNITINDTNVRTNDGGVQVIGQYDVIAWVCIDAEWVEISESNNS